MPFRSLFGSDTPARWVPTVIDAYHAIKINSITLIIRNGTAAAATGRIGIGFDTPAIVAASTVGDNDPEIHFQIEMPADTSMVVPIPGIDKIIGDFIEIATNTGDYTVIALVFYEEIKTSFDQYGQASKTIKRVMVK